MQSPGSHRGVAPFRLGAPPGAPFSPALPAGAIVRQGRATLRPSGCLASSPVRPGGAPSLPPGQAGRPLRGDRPAPPAFCTSSLPGPGRLRCAQTAGPRAMRPAPRHKTTDAPPSAPGWPAWLPVTSFVGDRQPRAFSFLPAVVTRPPLCFGRDSDSLSHAKGQACAWNGNVPCLSAIRPLRLE